MRVRRLSLSLTSFALIAFLAGLAIAQLNQGTARITVSSCGQIAPGATAKIVVDGTPQTRIANAQGIVVFEALPPATYTTTVELEGYAPGETELTVQAEETTTADVNLRPAICEAKETDESCCSRSGR